MSKSIIKKTERQIPEDAFIFQMQGECTFGEGEEKKNLRLTLYDGSIVRHWYWGNLAFDLSSMKLAKKKIPILADHDTGLRIGFSTGASFEGKFILEGKSLDNEEARNFRADAEAGFPFESSLRFDPNKSKIVFIKENETAEVNGRTLKGPGTLIQNAVIMEGSVCTFGALNNTATESFERSQAMANEIEMTAEALAQQHPQAYKQIVDAARTEGIKSEMERFTKFREKFADDPAFLVEQFAAAASLEQAVAAQNEKLKQEITAMKAKAAEKPPAPATPAAATPAPAAAAPTANTAPSPARQEFSDDQGKAAETTDEPLAQFRKDKAYKEFLLMNNKDEPEALKKWQALQKAVKQGLVRGV